MTPRLRFASAIAVLCVVIPWQRSLWAQGNPGDETLTHKCQFVRAALMAEMLEDILPNPNALAAYGGLKQLAGKLPQPAGNLARPKKPYSVDYDDRTNTVFVTGPPDKINLAKQAMIKLDVLDKQAQRDRRGEKISLQTYQVPAGTTESTAKMLQQFFRLPGTRINSVDAAQIVVCAPVADLVEIAELLKRAPPPQGAAGVFVLKDAEARKIASLVLDKLSKDPAAPLVRFDWSDNAVVVYGSPNQVEAVRLMIESLSGEKVQASQAHKGD